MPNSIDTTPNGWPPVKVAKQLGSSLLEFGTWNLGFYFMNLTLIDKNKLVSKHQYFEKKDPFYNQSHFRIWQI